MFSSPTTNRMYSQQGGDVIIRTRLVTVGSWRATAIKWPSRVLVLSSLRRTLVALVQSCSVCEYEKLLALGRLFTSDMTIYTNDNLSYYTQRPEYQSINQSINQSIKTDLYRAVCRRRIRGARWQGGTRWSKQCQTVSSLTYGQKYHEQFTGSTVKWERVPDSRGANTKGFGRQC